MTTQKQKDNSRKIIVRVCIGTGGLAAGGKEVIAAFKKAINDACVDVDVDFTCHYQKVGCRGFCARDVLVDVVDGDESITYQGMEPEMARRIVEDHLIGGKPVRKWLIDDSYYAFYEKQQKILLVDCGTIDPEDIDAYMKVGGYGGIQKVLKEMTPEDLIAEMKASGLRGRGGAGFPTWLKWDLCKKSASDKKYMVCNADEGDPGAFMDRSLIEGNPHSIIEGMMIAGYAIGASEGYVYIRAEYPAAVDRLKLAIEQAHQKGFLGENIFGSNFSFTVKIKLGAGAFVCGEETALIASIEGERGMPRAKPPFPAQSGLWGKPTVINNVETLSNIPYIIRNGAQWFSSYGTEKSKGTKVFALTGKVKNTGLIEVPMGIRLGEIIYDIGGGIIEDKKLKAVQTGGPSGGCIPANLLDTPVDYESLAKVGSIVGSGGMVVLDEDDCMVNVAKFFLEFTQAESCGKCVPCRVGTKRLLEIMERITSGRGKESDIPLLERLSNDIKSASLCGLGQTAPNPILSTLKYFREEYEAHLEGRCPAKVCKELLTYTVLEEFCKGCGACLRACSVGAVSGEKKKPHVIDESLCVKCGACFDVCKFNAVARD
ncbi:MAG: NADH-quinone oxidoreductase subunit NuoF [Nitrospirota bacterium]|jgi:NADH:ubiquinone oxidoreductase subunit F (NADH-binding)/(2Fe-2S) ferredoxin/Pyruvate/2-oxoacid:ferredoxin oxidoreductase delta subunit